MILVGLAGCREDPDHRACAHPDPPAIEVATDRPPTRILVVSLDTTRADHLGAWGDPRGLTPALDQLAAESVRFAQAHAHAPWTKPAMGSVMAGVLPRDHGVLRWADELRPDQPTLATAVHAAGWRTEAYVTHIAFLPQENRFDAGFDVFRLTWQDQPGQADAVPTDIETSTQVTDEAIAALERLDAGPDPFLLWVHYLDPHSVYLHHPDVVSIGNSRPALYAEEIAWTDAQLGRLLAVAEADPGLVIAVVGDHGEELHDHGHWEHTRTLYEELLHVVLLVRAPGVEPAVVEAPVGTADLAPTLLDLVGVPIPDDFTGSSWVGGAQLRPIFAETERVWDKRAVLAWPWTLIWDLQAADGHQGELYDLCADPTETSDRFRREPDRADRLQRALSEVYPDVP